MTTRTSTACGSWGCRWWATCRRRAAWTARVAAGRLRIQCPPGRNGAPLSRSPLGQRHPPFGPGARLGRDRGGHGGFAGAVIQPDAILGRHVIINTGATVDHDCRLGDFVHVAPGAHLAGGVRIDPGGFMGIGSVAVPGVHLGTGCVVGAGAVVVRDLLPNVTAIGVPARPTRGRADLGRNADPQSAGGEPGHQGVQALGDRVGRLVAEHRLDPAQVGLGVPDVPFPGRGVLALFRARPEPAPPRAARGSSRYSWVRVVRPPKATLYTSPTAAAGARPARRLAWTAFARSRNPGWFRHRR